MIFLKVLFYILKVFLFPDRVPGRLSVLSGVKETQWRRSEGRTPIICFESKFRRREFPAVMVNGSSDGDCDGDGG